MNTLSAQASRYSRGAILLHWLIAFALAIELAVGFGMPRDASGFALFQFHKSLGITILVLTLVRIGWRLTHPSPPALEGGLGGLLAKGVHVLLYVFMIGAPLTGWAVVSTSPIEVPTVLWGVVPLPHLPLDKGLVEAFEESHELIAFMGMALFVLHVAGALRHHFLMKDAIMARMSPRGSAGIGLALLAAVLVVHFGTVAVLPGHEEGERAEEEASAANPADAAALPAEEATPAVDDAGLEEEATAEEGEDAAAAGPPPSWDIQPGGTLGFSVDNGGTALNGSFRRWDGQITMNPDDPAGSSIVIEIDLASATLGDATQDRMLGESEFFNTAANPTATFRSTNVEKTGANSYRARGTLTLKGTSRPQTITFTLSGSGNRRQVNGSGTVDRNAFSVGTGESAAGLGGSVRVDFAFSATS